MTAGEKIVAVAEERGLSLVEVARRAGILYGTLINYTSPKRKSLPSTPIGIAIAAALDVEIQWLFDDARGLPAPRYIPPQPSRIRELFPGEFLWQEVDLAVRYRRRKRMCYYVVYHANAMRQRGHEEAAKALEEYAANMEDLAEALDLDDYRRVAPLRVKRMELEERHPFIKEIISMEFSNHHFLDRDVAGEHTDPFALSRAEKHSGKLKDSSDRKTE